jgi:hypothetical protein
LQFRGKAVFAMSAKEQIKEKAKEFYLALVARLRRFFDWARLFAGVSLRRVGDV